MLRLLLCGLVFSFVLVLALDEREYDVKVAPISTIGKIKRPLYSWPKLLAQLRRAFKPEITSIPRIRKISTPAPTLEFYGALNPIYQTGQF